MSPELDSKEKMIGGLIVELIMRLQFNTHSITEASDAIPTAKNIMKGEFENRTRIVGTAIYPTMALLNHSCDNNIYKYFVGNKIIVLASKVISILILLKSTGSTLSSENLTFFFFLTLDLSQESLEVSMKVYHSVIGPLEMPIYLNLT